MSDILLGRQPVFDARERLHAYELLCRGPTLADDDSLDGDRRTASVVLNAFVEIGLENVVGDKRVFVRMTPRFLVEELYRILPTRRVVLTVEMRRDPAPEVLEALARAQDVGYAIALDRFRRRPATEPLLGLAEYARVDLLEVDVEDAAREAETIRGAGVRAVAYRVETRSVFDRCRSGGFEFFQGFFFSTPDELRLSTPPPQRFVVAQLLARLRRPDVDLRQVARLVEGSPQLSYRVLRTVNSALHSLSRRVDSIRHGVVLLGLDRVKDLVTLTLLAGVAGVPDELTTLALVRARTCQLLARRAQPRREETFFTVGLLSILDVLLHRPMKEALDDLPLTDEVHTAILEHEGPAGLALDAALSCEGHTCDPRAFAAYGFRAIREAHLEALRWARDLHRLLPAGAPSA